MLSTMLFYTHSIASTVVQVTISNIVIAPSSLLHVRLIMESFGVAACHLDNHLLLIYYDFFYSKNNDIETCISFESILIY